jgi:hypothetical protein
MTTVRRSLPRLLPHPTVNGSLNGERRGQITRTLPASYKWSHHSLAGPAKRGQFSGIFARHPTPCTEHPGIVVPPRHRIKAGLSRSKRRKQRGPHLAFTPLPLLPPVQSLLAHGSAPMALPNCCSRDSIQSPRARAGKAPRDSTVFDPEAQTRRDLAEVPWHPALLINRCFS